MLKETLKLHDRVHVIVEGVHIMTGKITDFDSNDYEPLDPPVETYEVTPTYSIGLRPEKFGLTLGKPHWFKADEIAKVGR